MRKYENKWIVRTYVTWITHLPIHLFTACSFSFFCEAM